MVTIVEFVDIYDSQKAKAPPPVKKTHGALAGRSVNQKSNSSVMKAVFAGVVVGFGLGHALGLALKQYSQNSAPCIEGFYNNQTLNQCWMNGKGERSAKLLTVSHTALNSTPITNLTNATDQTNAMCLLDAPPFFTNQTNATASRNDTNLIETNPVDRTLDERIGNVVEYVVSGVVFVDCVNTLRKAFYG